MPSIPILTYTLNVPCSNQFSHLQHVPDSTSGPILLPSVSNHLHQSPSVEAGQAPSTSDPLLITTHPSSNTISTPLPSNNHPMIIRSKAGISKPKVLLATTDLSTTEPKSVTSALSHPKWHMAMLSMMH